MKALRNNLSSLAFGLLLVALLPIKTDGADTPCCEVSTSLAASILQPVAGDQDFFALPTGPSAVMFVIDNSGSMTDFPQCADGWGNSPCTTPSMTTPPNPTGSAYLPRVGTGSCTMPATGAGSWMNAVALSTTSADPGFTGAVSDSPPWSTIGGCTGDNCLFDPDSYYNYGNWTETSARRILAASRCIATDDDGTAITDYLGHTLDASSDPNCASCLNSKGFYFFNIRYRRTSTQYATYRGVVFRGNFLNANPPKYVSARRAVKTLLKIDDPANLQPRDYIRYGLATFWNTTAAGADLANDNGGNSSGPLTGDGAKLLVPLGPNCTDADPTALNATAIVASRNAIINAVNATGTQKIRFNNYTPLAESLYNAGQYFSDLGTGGAHESRFAAKWVKKGCPKYSSAGVCSYTAAQIAAPTVSSPAGAYYDASQDFRESSAGLVNAAWAAPGQNQHSVCFACQTSSIIVVTDGMPNNESGLPSNTTTTNHTNQPAWDFQRWQPTDYRSSCGGHRNATGDGCQSYLPLVALYLKQQDQRLNDFTSGFQNIITSTVSFGITATQPLKMLAATAALGGGVFSNAGNYDELLESIQKAVNAVVQRATSFSATAANSLQTSQTTSSESFVARFRPNSGRFWDGHLFNAILFDEQAMGCDSTVGPTDQAKVACGNTTVYPNYPDPLTGVGDIDPVTLKNICTSVYLVDKDCDEIADDPTGKFVFIKKKTAGYPTPLEANLWWDAGKTLSDPSASGYRSAADAPASCATNPGSCGGSRNIFTWLSGSKVMLHAYDTTSMSTLIPFLALDQTSCNAILATAGYPSTGTWPGSGTTGRQYLCAQQIINYVRGWDVADQDRDLCYGPNSPGNTGTGCTSAGEQRNWSATATNPLWKLGDIFHSTPAVVKPPLNEPECDLGYENQCVSTIHSPSNLPDPTPMQYYAGVTAGNVDAYERYRLDQRTRTRIVVVGANDGMLHAFQAGEADTGQPTDIFGKYPYTQGNGEELWAFVPPDLLPKLKYLLLNGSDPKIGHQYFVDGSTMVRDIWVDNGPADGTKQRYEFHTIAIISERSGGTQFHALDVTDTRNPTYRWTFPPPCSEDAKYMGESWSEFAPRPPPIGPVKLASATDPRGFEERWVVMLNGGYDPAMTKGRAVWTVDVWSGATLWRFTDDDFKASTKYNRGNTTSMWPVTASVGMVHIGNISNTPYYDEGGYFDAATWGDWGGNLWVARFYEPGTLTSGMVTNWFVGRAFEQQRRSADDAQYLTSTGGAVTPPSEVRSAFSFMTANVYEGGSRTLRTFLGSGNREIMLWDVTCGPDNVLGCCQAGCDYADTTTTDDFGGCTRTQHFRCEAGLLTRYPTTDTSCSLPLTCGGSPRNKFTSTTVFSASCGGSAFTTTATADCDSSGVCTTFTPMGESSAVSKSYLTNPQTHNRFYSIWAYGGPAAKNINTMATARTFDDNRFTDVTLAGKSCAGPTGNTCTLVNVTQAQATYDPAYPSAMTVTCADASACRGATAQDAGWFYEYGRVCPTGTCSPAPPWTDEKTSSAPAVFAQCLRWTGFRPIGATASGACDSTLGSPTVYGYGSDAVTGLATKSCSYDDLNGTVFRGAQRQTWTPPSAPTCRVSINQQGQVTYSTIQIDPGASPDSKQLGQRSSVGDTMYWLEVPRQLHQCRHVDPTSCE